MFTWIRFSVILVALTHLEPSFERSPFSIIFESCDVLKVSAYCGLNCSVSKSNKITSYLNILEEGEKIAFSIQLLGKSPTMKEYAKMFESSLEDICPLLSSSSSGNMLLIVLNELKEYGNIPTCPIKKGVYYLKDYSFSSHKLPPYVPEGQFMLILGMSGYRADGSHEKCANVSLKGSVRSKLNLFGGKRKN